MVTIFGLIFVGVGGFLVVGILIDLVRRDRSAAWPQVKGKVLTSRIDEEDYGESTTYSAKVSYQYVVDGDWYSSNRRAFRWGSMGKQSAKRTVERYPAGSPVTVYYDPQKPSSSVLEREIEAGSIFAFLVALVFIGIGIFIMFSGS